MERPLPLFPYTSHGCQSAQPPGAPAGFQGRNTTRWAWGRTKTAGVPSRALPSRDRAPTVVLQGEDVDTLPSGAEKLSVDADTPGELPA